MTMIKLKVGENLYQKKGTVNDVISTLKFIDDVANVEKYSDRVLRQYEYVVELFGSQGLTMDDILNLDAKEVENLAADIDKIFDVLNGTSEEDKKNAEKVDPKKR